MESTFKLPVNTINHILLLKLSLLDDQVPMSFTNSIEAISRNGNTNWFYSRWDPVLLADVEEYLFLTNLLLVVGDSQISQLLVLCRYLPLIILSIH